MFFIIAFILQESASQKRMQRNWKKQISRVKEKKQRKKSREKEVSYIMASRTSMAGIFGIYNFLIYTVLLFLSIVSVNLRHDKKIY